MKFKPIVSALTAASLIALPTVGMAAASNNAAVSKLSVRSAPAVRQGASTSKKSNLEGGSIVIALLAAAAVIAGIVIVADGDNKSSSPS